MRSITAWRLAQPHLAVHDAPQASDALFDERWRTVREVQAQHLVARRPGEERAAGNESDLIDQRIPEQVLRAQTRRQLGPDEQPHRDA